MMIFDLNWLHSSLLVICSKVLSFTDRGTILYLSKLSFEIWTNSCKQLDCFKASG